MYNLTDYKLYKGRNLCFAHCPIPSTYTEAGN